MRSPSPPPGRDAWVLTRFAYATLEVTADRWTSKEKARVLRARVLRELVETEEYYVQQLKYVIDRFIVPLRNAGKEAHAADVWGGWEPIAKLHEEFVKRLREAMGGRNNKNKDAKLFFLSSLKGYFSALERDAAVTARRVAQEFSRLAPMLLLYIPFVKAYGFALGRLSSDLRSGGPISELSQKQGARPSPHELSSSQRPADLLALPFQRLCKYGLLLRELAKTFPETSRGRALWSVVSVVDETVAKVNAAKARSETSQRALQIQSALVVGYSGSTTVGSPAGHFKGRGFEAIMQISSTTPDAFQVRVEGGGAGEGKSAARQTELAPGATVQIMQAHRRLVWEGLVSGGVRLARLPLPASAQTVPWEANWSVPGPAGCWLAVFSDLVLVAQRRSPDKWRDERLDLRWAMQVAEMEIVRELAPPGTLGRGLHLVWNRPAPYCKVMVRIEWARHDARSAADVGDVLKAIIKRQSGRRQEL